MIKQKDYSTIIQEDQDTILEDSYVFPTSFAQQRLWFLDQLEPNNPTYNIPLTWRIKGRLNVAALEAALNEIVRRHESLRTTFSVIDGRPVQIIAERMRIRLGVVDLESLDEKEREKEARRLAVEDAQRPFNLRVGPLMRIALLRVAEEDYIAILTFHHIVSDGWSTEVLWREVGELYEALQPDSQLLQT